MYVTKSPIRMPIIISYASWYERKYVNQQPFLRKNKENFSFIFSLTLCVFSSVLHYVLVVYLRVLIRQEMAPQKLRIVHSKVWNRETYCGLIEHVVPDIGDVKGAYTIDTIRYNLDTIGEKVQLTKGGTMWKCFWWYNNQWDASLTYTQLPCTLVELNVSSFTTPLERR